MNRHLIISIFVLVTALNCFADLQFSGNVKPVVTVTATPSSGLECVYVLDNTEGVSISLSGNDIVKWSRFGSAGAAYAESVGTSKSIELGSDDSGYIAEVEGRSYYFWIVNYEKHKYYASELKLDPESTDCQRYVFTFIGNAKPMTYYSINGKAESINRQIELSYSTMQYDSDMHNYKTVEATKYFESINSTVYADASLIDTSFSLTGDRFMAYWGDAVSITTPEIKSMSIAAETDAEQIQRDIDNEQTVSVGALGGSAPCEIIFSAAVTDAASFYEWQLSSNQDFDQIDDRYRQTELDYTFKEYGTTYVRFFAANSDGGCEYISPTYDVTIGESSLICPNAFSPQSSPGVNDEWKVSYKSIVSFECHIFNRWGTEMFSFTDPSLGWDGKYKNKYVPAGVYYYVIKARGSDGRTYNLSGDINIITSKNTNLSNGEIY